jgi:tetratricopeptide (TPR) repeat protein
MITVPIFRRMIVALAILASCAFTPCLRAHGDLHERIATLTAQILTNQAVPELWLQRADLNREHGEYDAAISDLDRAAQLRPGWSAVPLQRARISYDTGKFAGCELAATDCLKLDPANADALVLRARAFVQMGKPALAIADYDAVLNATNSAASLPDLYLERSRALASLKRWDEAIAGLDAGMKRLGSTPSLALPAIDYERQRGHFDAALARLAQARKFFSEESYNQLRTEILQQTKTK